MIMTHFISLRIVLTNIIVMQGILRSLTVFYNAKFFLLLQDESLQKLHN